MDQHRRPRVSRWMGGHARRSSLAFGHHRGPQPGPFGGEFGAGGGPGGRRAAFDFEFPDGPRGFGGNGGGGRRGGPRFSPPDSPGAGGHGFGGPGEPTDLFDCSSWSHNTPWYPSAPHLWERSGPQALTMPPTDAIAFAENFSAESPRRTLHGVREFYEVLCKLILNLQDLKSRFEIKVTPITAFSNKDTISIVWRDFIGTLGALDFVTGGPLDSRRELRGVHILQSECESLRHRLVEVAYESTRGPGVSADGGQTELDSILDNLKCTGADIVSALYGMPKHLRYLDKAISDGNGPKRYLEETQTEWTTMEEYRKRAHDDMRERQAAKAREDEENAAQEHNR